MIVSLNGISLPSDLHWSNEFEWYGATGSSERTLGGGLVIWTGFLSGGRPIDLVATETRGWLTYAQIKSLIALAQDPISYELIINGQSRQVMFRYEDAPCIEVAPLVSSRINFVDTDFFTGTIKLLEV